MNKSRWQSLGAFCGIAVVLFSVVARADEEEATGESTQDPPATFASEEQSAKEKPEEKSILVSQEPDKTGKSDHDFCHCVGESKSSVEQRIKEVLRGPLRSTGIDYTEAPLNELLEDMSQEYDFPVYLDEKALKAIGLTSDEPITIQQRNISVRSALRLILRRLDLAYVIRDEVLFITSQDEADRYLVTCVYDVDALVDGKAESADSLIDSIVTCVATESWAENGGGEAEVRWLQPGLLVVSQTQEVQEEVTGLLDSIRKMREQVPFTHSPSPEPAEQK